MKIKEVVAILVNRPTFHVKPIIVCKDGRTSQQATVSWCLKLQDSETNNIR